MNRTHQDEFSKFVVPYSRTHGVAERTSVANCPPTGNLIYKTTNNSLITCTNIVVNFPATALIGFVFVVELIIVLVERLIKTLDEDLFSVIRLWRTLFRGIEYESPSSRRSEADPFREGPTPPTRSLLISGSGSPTGYRTTRIL